MTKLHPGKNLSKSDSKAWPAHVAEWLMHNPCAVEHNALSGRGSRLSPGEYAKQRIISNNSYTHDEQGVYPGRSKGSTVSSINWPLLMPWLAAPRY